MRLFRIMAAVGKAKPPVSERVPSAGKSNTQRGQALRTFHPNSSPVYKTQSDTSLLSAGVRNLTLRDTQQNKRTLSNRSGSGNGVVRSLEDIAKLLQSETVKNVVVVAGAGISTPSGIPDFRSPGTGLYANLQQYQIPYPEAIFDIDYFHQNPRPFFTLAKELYPSGKYRPNYIHYFVRLLYNKGMLLRMYTQNIDGLERLAGVPTEKLVEAHGTFATATCTICGLKCQGSEVKEKIFSDKLPRCRSRGCIGIMKPDIVFFGEDLPSRFYCYLKDMLQTDLVIVMGTSLEVQPFAGIIDSVRWTVPRLLFNRNAVGPFKNNRRSKDMVSPGDLISNLQKFAGMAGWKEDMVDLITEHEGSLKVATRVRRSVPRRLNPLKTFKPTKTGDKKLPSVSIKANDTGGGAGKSSAPPPSVSDNTKNGRNPNPSKENYSSLLFRPSGHMNIYRYSNASESSSEESETETDTSSSSDSSEEDKKPRNKNNIVRNRVPVVNKTSNGATVRNGYRSSSAKVGNNALNKKPENGTTNPEKPTRKFGTLASPNSVAAGKGNNSVGSFTGRSVKSESGVTKDLVRRRADEKKLDPVISNHDNKPSVKEKKLEAFVNGIENSLAIDKTKLALNGGDSQAVTQQKLEAFVNGCENISDVDNKTTKVALNGTKDEGHVGEKDVLKTGGSSSVNRKGADKKISQPVETNPDTVESVGWLEAKPEKEKVFQKRGVNREVKPAEKRISSSELHKPVPPPVNNNTTVSNSLITERHARGAGPSLALLKKYCVNLKSPTPHDGTDKLQHQNSSERITPSEKSSGVTSPVLSIATESEKTGSVENDSGVSLTSGLQSVSSFHENDRIFVKRPPSTSASYSLIREKPIIADQFDPKLAVVRDANPEKPPLYHRQYGVETPEQTGQSSHQTVDTVTSKHGSLTPVNRKQIANKLSKDNGGAGKKSRKPPTGKKHKHKRKKQRELQSVNPRPYGYANLRKPPMQPGIGPFKRTKVRALNSSINSDPFQRSGSADLPRMNYRHRPLATLTGPSNPSSNGSEKSDYGFSDEDGH